jgi:hypothetical protein
VAVHLPPLCDDLGHEVIIDARDQRRITHPIQKPIEVDLILPCCFGTMTNFTPIAVNSIAERKIAKTLRPSNFCGYSSF